MVSGLSIVARPIPSLNSDWSTEPQVNFNETGVGPICSLDIKTEIVKQKETEQCIELSFMISDGQNVYFKTHYCKSLFELRYTVYM